MKISLNIELDCDNPNGAQIPPDVLMRLLESLVSESQILVYETDEGEWQLFVNSYTVKVESIEDSAP